MEDGRIRAFHPYTAVFYGRKKSVDGVFARF